MDFLIILLTVSAAVVLLRGPIGRYPLVLYVVAIILDLLMFAANIVMLPRYLSVPAVILMRRGGLGMALFAVVMFIGVFPQDGKVSRWLRPIRAELSIAACLLIAGHMISYLVLYIPGILGGASTRGNVLFAFVLALCLLVLTVLLGMTSMRAVKRRMTFRVWKRIQSLAYIFYAMVYAHLMFLMVPGAVSGGQQALVNIVVYSAVFIGYLIARVLRAWKDRRLEGTPTEAAADADSRA